MVKCARHLLFAALVALVFGQPVLAQDHTKTAEGVNYVTELMCGRTPCGIVAVLVHIDQTKRSIGLTSGTEYSAQKGGGAVIDDLVGYTVKSGALATFSGRNHDLEGFGRAGGLKILGDTLYSFEESWQSSAVICAGSRTEGLAIALSDIWDLPPSRERPSELGMNSKDLFFSDQNCVQHGPVIYIAGANGAKVRSIAEADMPQLDWKIAIDRSTLVQFRDGSIGFLYSENATLQDIADALPQIGAQVGGVDKAVSLNSGDWSGYIVRTENNAIFGGAVNTGFPSAFVVK